MGVLLRSMEVESYLVAGYTLPATDSILGGVKVDGSTITINDGVISSSPGYTLQPLAQQLLVV